MPIIDGTPVDASTTNQEFIYKKVDDTAIGKITLANTDPVSGSTIANTQRELNSINSFTGNANGSAHDVKPTWTNTDVGAPTDDLKARSEALTGAFGATFGHSHDGSTGGGAPIASSSLSNVVLKGSFLQGTDLTSVTGSSKDVSTEMSAKTASNSSTVKGVCVNTPYNRIILRQASGANKGDKFVDGSGNEVYGRITNSGATWTLSFFVDVSGTETAYTFASASNITWYYQQLFNPIVDAPVYSELAVTPSDNTTADVLDASETVAGKSMLAGTAPGAISSTGAKGTSTKVAKEDHTHEGVHSVNTRKGDVTLDKTDVGLSNVPNVDATNPSNITQDSTHRFVSDTEKSTWNAKEPAITSGSTSQYWRGDKTFQTLNTDAVPEGTTNEYFTIPRASAAAPVQSVAGKTGTVTLSNGDVGLGNVTNDAQLKRSANDYTGITEKTVVSANDLVLIEDSADSFNKKKVKMSNMGGGGGGGTVTAVTASAPLASSGGTTPNVSLTGIIPATNGGTGVNSTATFPTSGTVTTDAGTSALTNKDYDGGTASNTSRTTIPQNTTTNLNSLTRKKGTVVYNSTIDRPVFDDGTNLRQYEAQPWASGIYYQSGDIVNYSRCLYVCIGSHTSTTSFETDSLSTYWRFATVNDNLMFVGNNLEGSNSNGWNNFSITGYTAGTVPTTAPTIGSAATVSSPFAGDGSLKTLILSTATTFTAGTGYISPLFSVPTNCTGKALTLRFDFAIPSGSSLVNLSGTNSNTFYILIWDNVASKWIQPNGSFTINQSANTSSAEATFQLDVGSPALRVAILVANTNTSGTVNLQMANFRITKNVNPVGNVKTDWVSYTPTFTNLGTVTGAVFESRRDGDTLYVRGIFAAGTGAAAAATISLGFNGINGNVTIDPNKVSAFTILGKAGQANQSSTYFGMSAIRPSTASTNYVNLGMQQSTANELAPVNGNLIANGVSVSVDFSVPITGWSSNTVMSSDSDSRLMDFVGSIGSQSITANTTNIAATAVKDSHGNWNGTGFTPSSPGDFQVDITLVASVASDISYYINGTIGRTIFTALSTSWNSGSIIIPNLKTTDVVTFRGNASATLTANGTISISKLGGTSAIAATETISALYWLSANQSLTANVTPVNFDSKEEDSHSAVTTGASWKFTSPAPRLFHVTGVWSPSTTAANALIYKNGSAYKTAGGANISNNGNFSAHVRLKAGDYIELRSNATTTITGGALSSAIAANISIVSVGL